MQITWELATRFLAILGAVLGVWNAVSSYLHTAPRFKVTYTIKSRGPNREYLHIRVQNHGLIPITIEHFWMTKLPADNQGQKVCVGFKVLEGETLPKTIEQGQAATFRCSTATVLGSLEAGLNRVQVGTSTGEKVISGVPKNLSWSKAIES